MRTFYEFFAGGGMARAGFGDKWDCLFANDFDPKKASSYVSNWGSADMVCSDVAKLTTEDLPSNADVAWASFPCQDLSLAGAGAGLKGERSGTFWPFWNLMLSLKDEGRAPKVVVLENVCGALTSHDGKDFSEICSALSSAGYKFGALVIDAVHFVPQSRPRLFIIGVEQKVNIAPDLTMQNPNPAWHSPALIKAYEKVPSPIKSQWIWWNLPNPPLREINFSDLIEENPNNVSWHSRIETEKILGMMNNLHREKVRRVQDLGVLKVGTIYKRTRPDGYGGRVQRAEVRFDEIAGCLRTPSGGSSRQLIMVVEGENIRTRLLSPREAARLMGLSDDYCLPEKYNDAYHLAGDGVAVPVVRFLAEHIVEKLVPSRLSTTDRAA
ncbi:C-5 cytosine-specific DNA methylase [Alishewanella aestuarii B11]|uniref:DNA (cytosine-5-)-methyltransferase n=1 Tax=Alishewanella aestuarii B11 TaxID=1197174 RepID=J2IID3_9ALTE|nr:DNA cytosine methyltransferase [Alishewanella aestuarii]EJI87002.1 C-5 cytosine-specific DNA methylase [Alishewanella aestuarii B11]